MLFASQKTTRYCYLLCLSYLLLSACFTSCCLAVLLPVVCFSNYTCYLLVLLPVVCLSSSWLWGCLTSFCLMSSYLSDRLTSNYLLSAHPTTWLLTVATSCLVKYSSQITFLTFVVDPDSRGCLRSGAGSRSMDPDPHVPVGLDTWIRIRIRIEKKAGPGSALKLMRIHNNVSDHVFPTFKLCLERGGGVVTRPAVCDLQELLYLRKCYPLQWTWSNHRHGGGGAFPNSDVIQIYHSEKESSNE